jgi:hypothetical protein
MASPSPLQEFQVFGNESFALLVLLIEEFRLLANIERPQTIAIAAHRPFMPRPTAENRQHRIDR